MKKLLTVLAVLCLAVSQTNCERDDICDGKTETTPRLVVEFYDFNVPDEPKSVTNLDLQAIGNDSIIKFPTADKIMIPLRTDADAVTYNLTLNSDEDPATTPYTDKLEFNYSRNNVYVSRACGYKTVFALNNDPSLPDAYILNDVPLQADGNWIRNIVIDTYNLESENETHIRIYF